MIEKTEIKRIVYNDLGCDTEDMLEGARARRAEHRGGTVALTQGAKAVSAISAFVDKDLDGGVIAALDGPLQVAGYAKQQIQRAVDALQLAAQSERNRVLIADGEISGLESMIGLVKKRHDVEEAKAAAIAKALEEEAAAAAAGSNGANGRPTGVRPGPGVAQRRKAKAKPPPKVKAAKAKEAKAKSAEVKAAKAKSAKAPAKRRPGRPKKAK